ncbi:LysR family transcriptional regulator [Pseudomonas caspiana]|uniref:helix-turn-helix domain-containing protein n=1 Tax=Pseudomonas caspiana TaxID=1451454 RepID=UPI0026CB2AA7
MSRYREMEIFDAVARAGSLASAARHMELSQATIIRTMTILEGRLGCALLIRSSRGVNLSPEGELFATR